MNTNPVVRVKRSLVQGKVPEVIQLGLGELAINHYDGKLFIRQDTLGVGVGTTVIEIGGGSNNWVKKTTTYTASAGDWIIADTSSGSWTLTLPASPSTGDTVTIADGGNWATNNLTVGRNGSTIEGGTEDFILDVGQLIITFLYDGTTWEIFSSVGAQGEKGDPGDSYWVETLVGIHTLSNVGIGTTNPRYTLEVGTVGAAGTSLWVNGDARVTGILSVGQGTITLDGGNNQVNVGTGVTIHHTNGIQVGSNILHSSGLTINTLNTSGVSTFTELKVGTGGTIITATSGGLVGVGQTNPQYKLDVGGDINFTGTFYQNSSPFVASRWTAGTGNDIYRLLGNVGIGTTNPGEKLDVRGNLNVGGVDAGPNYIAFRGTTGDQPRSYNHTYIGERIWSGSESSELFIFKGNDVNAAPGPDRIRLAAAELWFDTYTTATGGASFESVATSANITTKMTLTGAGNLGIGITNPTTKLDVIGNSRIGGAASRSSSGLTVGFTNNNTFSVNADVGDSYRMLSLINESATTNAMSILGFRINPDGGSANAMLDMKFVQTGATNTSAIHYSFNHAGSFADRFSILSSGNVGIGITAPTQKLDVRGNTIIGAQVSGATATPPYLSLGANYTNTALRANCKIRLYDNGADVYGFNVGSAGDVQYHSTTTHQFYNSDVGTLTVNASGTSTPKEYRSTQTNSDQAYAGQHNVNAPFYNTFSQTGSQYQAIVKGRSVGAASTVVASFGVLHNTDNTHEIVFHRIKSDGTDVRYYNLTGNSGTIWHAGNDGAGSGLDADLLDGKNTGTSGNTIPLLDGSNTWSSSQTFTLNAGSYGASNAIRISTGFDPGISFTHTGTNYSVNLFVPGGVWSGGLAIGGGNYGNNLYQIWHAGNDGSGSGLDADLLDGLDSSRFVYGDNSNKTTNTGNINSALASGFYDTASGTGSPTATWYHVINSRHYNTGNHYAMQIAGNFFTASVGDLFYRVIDNGTPTSWYRIWHSGNDGSGSGLDADLLDGLNATSANTGSTVVSRDASGNFSAGTITADGTLSASSDISLGGELNFSSPNNKYIDFYTKAAGGTNYTAYLRLVDSGSTSFHVGMTLTREGSVDLYHNNIFRFATTGDGIRTYQNSGYWTGFGPTNGYVSASLEGGCYIDFRNESSVPKGSIHNIFFTNGGSELRFHSTASGVARTTDSRTLCMTAQSDGIVRFEKSIKVSNDNTTGGGIILADDGDIVDLNDGYCSMRFSLGVRIFSANRGGSAVITLSNGGVITSAAGTLGSNGNGTRTIQAGGSATGGSDGDIYYIY